MKCDNVDRKCRWKGTVGMLADHLVTCGFTLTPCPNSCDNEQDGKVMKKDLEQHLAEDCPNRDYECEYCGESSTYNTITQVHDKSCEKKILSCTNAACPQAMERQHLYQHAQFECEYTVIACKHQSIGCMTKLKRKDMAVHKQDDALHLRT